MKTKELHRNYAVDFLHEQSIIAFAGFFASITGIGILLYKENIPQATNWVSCLFTLEISSFFLRFYNYKLFKTLQARERFGCIMNFIDGIAIASCLLFLPQVPIADAIFMNMILLLLCAGSAMTSAGYRPLLWTFSGPVLFVQFIFFSYFFITTELHYYGVMAFIVIFSAYLVHGTAKTTREAFYNVIGAQIEAERANKSKSRFFAASTHDLRQPLAASGALLLLALKKNHDSGLEPLLQKSIHAVNMVDQQITPLMELARIDSDEFKVYEQKIDLVQCLNDVIPIFEPQLSKDVDLTTKINTKTAICYSDFELLKRIISNMIDNSVKYTKKGIIKVSLNSHFSHYDIIIHDTGVGIERNKLDLIFDEFYQVDNPDKDPDKGFGLGLPIVKRICDKLGLKCSITSELGSFTEISLIIPKPHKLMID